MSIRHILPFALSVVFCSGNFLHAQTRGIDSLKMRLNDGGDHRLQTLFALCSRGASLRSENFMAYARLAKDISTEKKDFSAQLLADFYIGKMLCL